LTWIEQASGYTCRLCRDPATGILMGYVAVAPEHPLFGCHFDALQLRSVKTPYKIVCARGDADHFWWFGFDTGPLNDALTIESFRQWYQAQSFSELKKLVQDSLSFSSHRVKSAQAEVNNLAQALDTFAQKCTARTSTP
jgi:hypothetical protein